MSMPGFTAQASICKPNGSYIMETGKGMPAGLLPQQLYVDPPIGSPLLNQIIADCIDGCGRDRDACKSPANCGKACSSPTARVTCAAGCVGRCFALPGLMQPDCLVACADACYFRCVSRCQIHCDALYTDCVSNCYPYARPVSGTILTLGGR